MFSSRLGLFYGTKKKAIAPRDRPSTLFNCLSQINYIKTMRTPLQIELEKSAIAPDIATLNFQYLEASTDSEYSAAWDYVVYDSSLDKYRNDGRLRDKELKTYDHLNDGGWWCAGLDILTGKDSEWGCFKPNRPRKDKEGKIIKYEHPPGHPTSAFYLSVGIDSWYAIADKLELETPDLSDIPTTAIAYEFWQWVLNNPKIPIIITEGAKKTASLLSAGYVAVGLPGINGGYRTPRDEQMVKIGDPALVDCMTAIATKGREIIFCFDQDTKIATVRNCAFATETTAKLFRDHGCKTTVMSWNPLLEMKGIDDLHFEWGLAAVDQSFGDRLTVAKWKKTLKLTDDSPKPKPIKKAQTMSDEEVYAEKVEIAAQVLESNGYNVAEFPSLVEVQTTTPLQPASTYIADPKPDEGMAIAEDEEPAAPPSLTYQEIALQYLYSNGHYLAIEGKTLFKFNGKFYEQLSTVKERKRIQQWAANFVVFEKGKRRHAYLKPESINSIWEWVMETFNEEPKDLNPVGFNFDNGILRIHWQGNTPTWKLYPHHPSEKYMFCSPVRYDPNADPEMCDRLLSALDPIPRTVLLRNLSGIFDIDKINSLHHRPLRAGFAVGNGSNGKDTFRDIVSLLFPKRVVSVKLSNFVEYDKGKTIALKKLEHCWINWSSENNQETPLDKIESLNILVTGEKGCFEVEEKYIVKTTMDIAPKAVYIFNCNNPPIIKSGLKSLQSRIVIYNFNKTFEEHPDPRKGEIQADPRFKKDEKFQIEQVAPAFLNRMLEEFKNLALEGIDYRPLESGMLELQENSTHLWSFVQDVGLEADEKGFVQISELWELLREWYIDNGTLEIVYRQNDKDLETWNDQPIRFDKSITAKNQIFQRLSHLFPNIKHDKVTKGDRSIRNRACIKGLTLNPRKDEPKQITENNSEQVFIDFASPASPPCNPEVSASPPASPLPHLSNPASPYYSPSSPSEENKKEVVREAVDGQKEGGEAKMQGGEAKGEAKGEAVSLAKSTGEAGEAKTHKTLSSKIPEIKVGDRATIKPGCSVLTVDGNWEHGQILTVSQLGRKETADQVQLTNGKRAQWATISEIQLIQA
jgi:putative DNA primase/helicase